MDSTSEIGALIIEAGASGDLKKLKAIKRRVGDDREFRRICDVYSDFSTGRTVLHHAAEMGHFEICKFLIKNVKVCIDASTCKSWDTPLILAAKEERVKIVEYLINHDAAISMANFKGFTALHHAVLKDNRELMELLLIKGARIDADSVDGTPLHIAESRGNVEAVKFLLSRGTKAIIQNKDSIAQNMNAMDSNCEFGALIIEAGASGGLGKLKVIRRRINYEIEFLKICDEYRDFSTGQNVLHHAAGMGHFEICKFLIKNIKVHIDALTYKRDTPLMLAVKEERVKIVEYLINQGAEVSIANSKGSTALHYAVLKDNRELMELLLIKGALIDADSVDGTPLQCAASHGNVEAVKFLLSHGAKPNLCFSLMENALVCAIKSHSFECMDALLKGGADPNRHLYGLSPLSFAAKEGDTKFIKSLLEAEADPNIIGTGHAKPIVVAALAHNREGVEILFPLTEPLQRVPNWTVDGIMEYCHSEEIKKLREESRIRRLTTLDKSGQTAMRKKKYRLAIVFFRVANDIDPSNPKWASLRSLCHAHLGRRMHAIFEAEECIRLNTHCPDPYHEDAAAAAHIFKKFLIAGLAFTMDPHNDQTADAFRVAFFHFFASLFLMSSPTEIVSFTPQ